MKIEIKNNKIQLFFLVSVLTLVSFGLFQDTLGGYAKNNTIEDEAYASKFEVVITPPEEFSIEGNESFIEYCFLSMYDIKALNFQVYNNGEVDVICAPYIDEDIFYRVFISEVEQSEFVIKAKETISFQIYIGSNGLTTTEKPAKLTVDIKQFDGGE